MFSFSTPMTLAATLLVAIQAGAVTAEQQCQAAKNKAAGAYAMCRQKAEAALALSGDVTKYTAALAKCSARVANSWQRAIDKAGSAGIVCLDGPLTIMDFTNAITTHTSRLATALAGGELVIDSVLGTGQVTLYGVGSDADLHKGAPRSFTDNGDGTVTDNVTGLVWEKKSDDGSIHDKDNYYSWGMTSAPYTMNGTMVTTFLATLNSGSGFAGHTDWRIPNRFELESLLNLENFDPPVSAVFNTGCMPGCGVTTCSCTQTEFYWSSTSYYYPELAWAVLFNDGSVDGLWKEGGIDGYVRAVRGGQ